MADIAEIGRKIARICDFAYDENTRMLYETKDGDILGYDWPSLDAMHEAEEKLSFIQRVEYSRKLSHSVMDGMENVNLVMLDDDVEWGIIHASFEQRLQAFLEIMDTKEQFDEN